MSLAQTLRLELIAELIDYYPTVPSAKLEFSVSILEPEEPFIPFVSEEKNEREPQPLPEIVDDQISISTVVEETQVTEEPLAVKILNEADKLANLIRDGVLDD